MSFVEKTLHVSTVINTSLILLWTKHSMLLKDFPIIPDAVRPAARLEKPTAPRNETSIRTAVHSNNYFR